MKRLGDGFSSSLRHVLAPVTVAVVLAVGIVPAAAQFANPLGQFANPLGQIPAAAFGQGVGNALDAVRPDGPTPAPLAGQQPTAQPRSATGLSELELAEARRFCGARLSKGANAASGLGTIAIRNFSALEQDYCQRAGEVLLGYGYETFDGTRSAVALTNGAVSDTYRLGIGDELVVTLRGQISTTARAFVDREGRVTLQNLNPIPAAGRTFSEFRRELEARTQAAFIGTEVFVSLGVVRSLAVHVVGEVVTPGMHQLSSLSSVVDALVIAGGVKKTGSLRRIMVERGDQIFWVDVYDLLTGAGSTRDLGLYAGDRIIVPGLGATVAVAGKVRRPGIYELPEGVTATTVQAVIELAGGPLRPQGTRVLVRTFDASGKEFVRENVDRTSRATDGDLVVLEYPEDVQVGTVRLEGAVRVPGSRVRANALSVRELLGDVDAFQPGAYLPFAVLETTEPATQARGFFPVNLQRVMAGGIDFILGDHDRLIVLSLEDVRFLSSEALQSIIRPPRQEHGFGAGRPPLGATVATGPTSPAQAAQALVGTTPAGTRPVPVGTETVLPGDDAGGCSALDLLQMIVERTRSSRFATAVQIIDAADAAGARKAIAACPEVYRNNPDLLPFVLEHVVSLNGEIRIPGVYPVTTGTTVGVVVAVAGGVTIDADITRVEFTSVEAQPRSGVSTTTRVLLDLSGPQGAVTLINPGAIVRFSPVYSDMDTGPVLLAGEFIRPGYYDIRRGERLSAVIARAGGLTAQAYPFGAVFTREHVRRAQEEAYALASRELNAAVAYALSRGTLQPGAASALQLLSAQVDTTGALGRIVIEADPTVLQVRPEFDVMLEPGDTLLMPKRPNSVLVTGDVLNPAALQFVTGASPETYIRQAGGLQRSADRSSVFLVLPNGVAQPIALNAWTYNTIQIPPGSAIVVPKNPAPLSVLSLSRDIATLVSQIALTAASFAVITR